MKLHVLGSSSAGNCYLLSTTKEALILEAGVKFIEVKKALDFNTSKIVGCIITHEHGDHAKSAKELLDAGVEVFSTKGTLTAIKVENHPNAHAIDKLKNHKIGNFTILPFPVTHDVVDPVGYLISHPESGKILFVTDTAKIDFTFKKINHIMIEANYSEDITDERIMYGKLDVRQQRRVSASHMSIESTLQFLQQSDLTETRNIVLIHLSDGSSHAEKFKTITEEITGVPTHIADKGVIINFSTNPF